MLLLSERLSSSESDSGTYVSVAFLSSFAAVELLHRLDLVLACVCVCG